ncbi:MAG: hypothetical protein KDB14_15420 [Planctomycetales bacterium]|nr:hypothetical protein [Planctomycetales bacterium]
MSTSKLTRWWIAVLLACCLLGSGCRSVRTKDGPAPWWRRLLAGEDNWMSDPRSLEIERSLERPNRISIQ